MHIDIITTLLKSPFAPCEDHIVAQILDSDATLALSFPLNRIGHLILTRALTIGHLVEHGKQVLLTLSLGLSGIVLPLRLLLSVEAS